MTKVNSLVKMLERACAFPIGIAEYKVDPDEIETFDFGNRKESPDAVCALRALFHRNGQSPDE